MENQATYLKRIQTTYPHLLIDSIKTDSQGLVNDVLIINQTWVFRFPKNKEWALANLRNETRCLTLARQYIDLPLPVFEYHTDALGEFVAYRYLPGVPLQRHEILRQETAVQDQIAAQLATFLRQLHTIPTYALAAHNISPSVTNRTRERWLQLYADVKSELFPILMDFARDWVEYHFAPLLADEQWLVYEPCFMNGDVTAYHLLYNPAEQRLIGAIDFGTAGLGDPACDFACIINQYGESFLQRMVRFYSGILNHLDRARFWASTLELQWILAGLHSKDPSWFAVHIGRAFDRLPYGCT